MFFSIIINSYNRKNDLLTTLDSVLSQDYTDYEIIVIDDGSTDGTEAAMKNYIDSANIKYYWQENKGVAASRNQGIRLSRGDFISILDSDIICSKKWLSSIAEIFNSNKKIDIIGTWPILGNYYKYKEDMVAAGPPSGKSLIEVSRVGGGVSTIKREVFDNIGLLDETIRFGWEDNEFCWRAILCGYKVFYLYDILTFHMKDLSDPSRLPSQEWVYENLKNKVYMYLKIMNFRSNLFFLSQEFLRCIFFIIKYPERFLPIKDALFWIMRNRKAIAQSRRELSPKFKISHKQIEKLVAREKLLDKQNDTYLQRFIESSFPYT